MPEKVTLEQIKKAVLKLDRQLDPSGEEDAFRAAVVLLSALQVGTNVRKLARFTGYPKEYIEVIAQNCRNNRIWDGRGRTHANWFEKNGGFSFWLDINVALGLMQRECKAA